MSLEFVNPHNLHGVNHGSVNIYDNDKLAYDVNNRQRAGYDFVRTEIMKIEDLKFRAKLLREYRLACSHLKTQPFLTKYAKYLKINIL